MPKEVQDPVSGKKILGDTPGWQSYTDSSPRYGFAVEFPSPPIKQQQGFTAGGSQWIVMAHRGKETFAVVTVRPSLEIDRQHAEQFLKSAKQVAAGLKARVTAQRPVTIGKFAGTEFDYESRLDSKSYSGRIRLFATSNMFFQVSWMVSPGTRLNDDVLRFLDSFRFPAAAKLPRAPAGLPMEFPQAPS